MQDFAKLFIDCGNKAIKDGLTIIVLCVLASIVVRSQSPTATPSISNSEEVIRIASSLIRLDFQVVDKKNRQVKTLRADEIEVYQDGKLQKVTNLSYVEAKIEKAGGEAPREANPNTSSPSQTDSVRSREPGRLFTFVVDDGNCKSSMAGIDSAKDALRKFVVEEMLPNDRVAIYQTKSGSSLSRQYSSNKEKILLSIKNIDFSVSGRDCGKGLTDAIDFDPKFDSVVSPNEVLEQLNTASRSVTSLTVLKFALERLASVNGRKMIFFLSEGLAFSSGGLAKTHLQQISDKAAHSSVVIYTMDLRGVANAEHIQASDSITGIQLQEDPKLTERVFVEPRRNELKNSREGLAELAYATGGQFVSDQNSVNRAIKNIVENDSGHYLVTYTPVDEEFNGKEFHQIEIKLKNAEFNVRSRAGFYTRTEKSNRPDAKTSDNPLVQALSAPLDQEGINVRLTTIPGLDANKKISVRTLIFLSGKDLSFVDLSDNKKQVKLDIAVAALDEKSKVVYEFNRTNTLKLDAGSVKSILTNGLVFSADLPIDKKGVYDVRIAIRDANSRRVGIADEIVNLKDLTGENFSIHGLTITGEIGADGKPMYPNPQPPEKALSIPSNYTHSAIRRFVGGDKLFYKFAIQNSKNEEITTQVRLFSEGKLIVEGKEKSQLETVSNSSMHIMQNARTGTYTLQILAINKKTNKYVSKSIDFEVADSNGNGL
jgi:VWFA-related protein